MVRWTWLFYVAQGPQILSVLCPSTTDRFKVNGGHFKIVTGNFRVVSGKPTWLFSERLHASIISSPFTTGYFEVDRGHFKIVTGHFTMVSGKWTWLFYAPLGLYTFTILSLSTTY